MTHCNNCENELKESGIHYAFDEPYCEGCFENLFNYCCECESVIFREDTFHDRDGNTYCGECYEGDDDYDNDEDDCDYDCPNNPEVYDHDRTEIIHLSRKWLEGKFDAKKNISINKKDFFLESIRGIVGLVEKPVYVYGLKDRVDYQIAASENIVQKVKEYFKDITVIETGGVNRLGISFSLRKSGKEQIVNFIKHLTTT